MSNKLKKASKIFSRKLIESVIYPHFPSSEAWMRKFKIDLIPFMKGGDTWLSLGERIFNSMQKEYQNEYVLKSFLLSENGYDKTLNEIIVGGSRTDFIASGEEGLTLYEIKSAYDSILRLEKQLLDFVSTFQKVCLFVDSFQGEKVFKILDSQQSFKRVGLQFSNGEVVRESQVTPLEELDFDKIFSCLWYVERNSFSGRKSYNHKKNLEFWNEQTKQKRYAHFCSSLIKRKHTEGKGVQWLESIPSVFRPLLWKFRDIEDWQKEKVTNFLESLVVWA